MNENFENNVSQPNNEPNKEADKICSKCGKCPPCGKCLGAGIGILAVIIAAVILGIKYL